ncbi:MAG: GAF domain-containing protein [Planctomycetes bacterium]|nr:GAF domain-containing protein [Planctomycetota bacterium]
MTDRTELLERKLQREIDARRQAEELLESKASELFEARSALEAEVSRVERRNGEIELLHEVSMAGHEEEQVDQLLRRFIVAVRRMTRWPLAHVFEPSPDRQFLTSSGILATSETFCDCGEAILSRQFPVGHGPVGRAFVAKSALWIEEVSKIVELDLVPCAKPVRAGLFVPIVVLDRCVAVVEFYTLRSAEENERYIDTVQIAGDQIGGILTRWESQHRIHESYRELQSAQSRLVQSEKMASIGQLAAGVAHEINNPMGFVSSNLRSLREYLADLTRGVVTLKSLVDVAEGSSDSAVAERAAEVRQRLDELDFDFLMNDLGELVAETLEGGERIRRIVADLKDFSHVDSVEVSVENINTLLEKTLTVAANEIKYVAEVRRDFADVPEIPCFGGRVSQVFLNLLVNAAHAMEETGNITIRTDFDEEWVWVEIEDDGCGIPSENLDRIFDPFFTTKEVGKGTGLGLHLSYQIMESHGGTIRVASELGKGTKFRLEFPRSGPPTTTEAPARGFEEGTPA